jgi:hypothetical protein
MCQAFQQIFKVNNPKHAKFIARVFGIFSEEIVKVWAEDSRAPYKNLGRPTLRKRGEPAEKWTLDFTLEDRRNGQVFVVEMKCEIELLKFKYFILERDDHLNHHTKRAFVHAFLGAAKSPNDWDVAVAGKITNINGAILIWGDATQAGKDHVKNSKSLHEVLTIAEMRQDLCRWNSQEFKRLIADRQQWCDEMFVGLLG